MNTKKLLLVSLISFLLFSWALTTPALAQGRGRDAAAQTDERQVLHAILTEIQQLRNHIERNNLNTFRAQLIFERIRLHQERADRLSRQLEDVRGQITSLKADEQRLMENIKNTESQMEQERDQAELARLQNERKEAKSFLEQQRTLREAQGERENELNSQLQDKRRTLASLNTRLEALEREIEMQLTDNGSDSTRKP